MMSKNDQRTLAEYELSYLEELELYKKVLAITVLISINQHGIKGDGRGVRAMKIFTRQTLTALSLEKLLPTPSSSKPVDEDLWDNNSIASLTRNLIEGYLALHYFGIEKVTKEEAELRFFLLQLHRNVEWYNIRKGKMDATEQKQFDEGIPNQKAEIKNHVYLPQLSKERQKRALQGNEMYKTKMDFENELLICRDLRKQYRLLSNLVHPLPLALERIDNEKGRGTGSEADIIYSMQCVMLARKYLAGTLIGITEHFFNELGNKFKDVLEEIKPLQFSGFD